MLEFIRRVFGSGEAVDAGADGFVEGDNLGTRVETLSQASSYWLARQVQQKFDPFALYIFEREGAARAALAEQPYIHRAMDSGQLVCERTLMFGCVENEAGEFEAIVCGEELTRADWSAVRDAFIRHGGRCKNEQEPDEAAAPQVEPASGSTASVEFVREDRREMMGHTMEYRIHRGPDEAAAKAFLRDQAVDQGLLYLVVETPDGTWCRDRDGIYRE
jgi:hypothetical protein